MSQPIGILDNDERLPLGSRDSVVQEASLAI
jgi:hypothetical protein